MIELIVDRIKNGIEVRAPGFDSIIKLYIYYDISENSFMVVSSLDKDSPHALGLYRDDFTDSIIDLALTDRTRDNDD